MCSLTPSRIGIISSVDLKPGTLAKAFDVVAGQNRTHARIAIARLTHDAEARSSCLDRHIRANSFDDCVLATAERVLLFVPWQPTIANGRRSILSWWPGRISIKSQSLKWVPLGPLADAFTILDSRCTDHFHHAAWAAALCSHTPEVPLATPTYTPGLSGVFDLATERGRTQRLCGRCLDGPCSRVQNRAARSSGCRNRCRVCRAMSASPRHLRFSVLTFRLLDQTRFSTYDETRRRRTRRLSYCQTTTRNMAITIAARAGTCIVVGQAFQPDVRNVRLESLTY